jgi:hypothetical protein
MLIKRPITYEGGNMFKQLFVCTTLVTMLMVNLVNAQEPPPTSEKAKTDRSAGQQGCGANRK